MDPLLDSAVAARRNAHAPYSHFLVGAAVETRDGRIFGGCNIESASFGLTICAERSALFSAISNGVHPFEFTRIAIVGGPSLTPPCGACRQAIWDLCRDIEVILFHPDTGRQSFRLSQLFPEPFDDSAF